MSLTENARLSFETTLSSIDEGELLLRELHGVESLSTPYDFDLTLECTRRGGLHVDAIDALFGAEVTVGFGSDAMRRVSGVISHVELVSISSDGEHSEYRMELVPRFWRTKLVHRSRCFVGKSIPEVIRAVLGEHGWAEKTDFELRIDDGDYPANADGHVVQYEESDFNFLSRWMERLGLFYFFEQSDSGDLVRAPDNPDLTYSHRLDISDAGRITGLRRMTRVRPQKVRIQDYNWRNDAKTAIIVGDAPVDAAGYGLQAYYGRHVATNEAAQRQAAIRSEEWLAGKHTYVGSSVNQDFWPGQRVKIAGSPHGEFDLEYVLTSVVHQASSGSGGGTYSNSVEMIDYGSQYRAPQRATWPRIDGVMHARVDYENVSSAAPVDNFGRYRVVLPYDLYGAFGQNPSRWIRKAEGYAGPGQGIHFTLHPGAEVLLAHIDGDPDRPIIVGAVPNEAKKSPVTNAQSTRHGIRTRSGIVIDFQDDAG
jgi:type VI secretion system secreted protein VgrG